MEQPYSEVVPKFDEELCKKLRSLWRNGKLCDAAIEVGSRVYKAHKLVLAAGSPVFSSMAGSLQENSQMLVQLPADTQTAAIELVIDFLYTGQISVTSTVYKTVLQLAQLFKIQPLIDFCVKFEWNHKGNSSGTNFSSFSTRSRKCSNGVGLENSCVRSVRGRGIKPGCSPSRGRGSVMTPVKDASKNDTKIMSFRGRGRRRGRGRGAGRGRANKTVIKEELSLDESVIDTNESDVTLTSSRNDNVIASNVLTNSYNVPVVRKPAMTRAEIQKAYRERKIAAMTPEELIEYKAKEAYRVRMRSGGYVKGPLRERRSRGRGRGRGLGVRLNFNASQKGGVKKIQDQVKSEPGSILTTKEKRRMEYVKKKMREIRERKKKGNPESHRIKQRYVPRALLSEEKLEQARQKGRAQARNWRERNKKNTEIPEDQIENINDDAFESSQNIYIDTNQQVDEQVYLSGHLGIASEDAAGFSIPQSEDLDAIQLKVPNDLQTNFSLDSKVIETESQLAIQITNFGDLGETVIVETNPDEIVGVSEQVNSDKFASPGLLLSDSEIKQETVTLEVTDGNKQEKGVKNDYLLNVDGSRDIECHIENTLIENVDASVRVKENISVVESNSSTANVLETTNNT